MKKYSVSGHWCGADSMLYVIIQAWKQRKIVASEENDSEQSFQEVFKLQIIQMVGTSHLFGYKSI